MSVENSVEQGDATKLGKHYFGRPVLCADDILQNASEKLPKPSLFSRLKTKIQCKHPEPLQYLRTGWGAFRNTIPLIDTLLHYRWRTDLVSDITSGLTVGVMNVPQGMAYSMLAGLPPVYGLYVSFLAPLLYAFLGRCPQLSVGTFAIVCLLLSEPIGRVCDEFKGETNSTVYSESLSSELKCVDEDGVDLKPIIALTLTFLIGIVQTVVGLLRIGNLMVYMAPAMIDGFVTGAAFHVLSSQLNTLFGIDEAAKEEGVGSVFMVFVNIFKYIKTTNLITLGISALSITFLLLIKMGVEPALKRFAKFHYPLPSELIVIIIGTVVSTLLNLKSTHDVAIIGEIATGMPSISVPKWYLIPSMVTDSVIIGITSTCMTISLVKVFVLKYHLEMEYNYELTAYGLISMLCSFFSSFAPAASVSRCSVCEGAGAKTTLNGIFSSILIVFVLLFLGPYFSPTPKCILSAIIAVALKNLLLQVTRLPKLWKQFKRDFFLFGVTFLVTLIVGVTAGLIVGVIGCLLALSEPQRKFRLLLLKSIPGTELFVNQQRELKSEFTESNVAEATTLGKGEVPILVCRLAGSLNFASVENFCQCVKQLIDQKFSTLSKKHENGSGKNEPTWTSDEQAKERELQVTDDGVCNISSPVRERKWSKAYFVLDLTGLSLIDPYGASVLADMHRDCYASDTYGVYIGDLRRHKCLDTSSWPHPPDLPFSYLSLHDAVAACQQHYKTSRLITAI